MTLQGRQSIEEQIERKFKWKRYNKATDAVFPITLRRIYNDGKEHKESAIGTAFYMHSQENSCGLLVSNYHCFAGNDPFTGKNIGSFTPNFVDIEFRYTKPSQESGFLDVLQKTARFPLIDTDENSLFFDLLKEKESSYQADLAILPVEIPQSIPELQDSQILFGCDAFWDFHLDTSLSVGEDCFVVGFPHGLRGDGRLPIWKRASIASEPVNTYNGKISFLVDAVTRKGMSGSPVVVRKFSKFKRDRLPSNLQDILEEKLVGVYSGRVGDDEQGVQLGIVWPIELVELLIASLPNPLTTSKPEFIEMDQVDKT